MQDYGQVILSTENVTKKYPKTIAVDSVNLRVCRGDVYGLIGLNGAGKTTLMKMLLGLTLPTCGFVNLFGTSDKLNDKRVKIGSLIEDPALYANCSAKENMKRFAVLYGADFSKIDELLKIVGLGDVGNKKTAKFSLGMKQRLGLAIALLNDPEIMILDEPMNGLDPAGIKEIRDVIIDLNKRRGVTFIISSHIIGELAKVANVFGIMRAGRLVEEITERKIQETCVSHVNVSTEDDARAALVIKENFPELEVTVTENGLVVLAKREKVAAVNAALAAEKISVYSLTSSEDDFEQFFIDRMG